MRVEEGGRDLNWAGAYLAGRSSSHMMRPSCVVLHYHNCFSPAVL